MGGNDHRQRVLERALEAEPLDRRGSHVCHWCVWLAITLFFLVGVSLLPTVVHTWGNRPCIQKTGKCFVLILCFLAPFFRCAEDTARGVAGALPILCASLSPQSPSLLGQRPSLRSSEPHPCCRPQSTSRRGFHESCFTMQIFPHRPSVLSVETTHVHSVFQSSAVQVSVGNVGERAASVLPPLSHLSGSCGVQPKSISVATTLDMGAVYKPPATLRETENTMGPLPCHPNRLGQFRVLVPHAEPPRENAEARLDGGVVLLSQSNLDGGDGATLVATHTRTCGCCASTPWEPCSTPQAMERQVPLV